MNTRLSTTYLLLDGKLLSGNGSDIYVGGNEIVVWPDLTGVSGQMYPRSNPSGFITGLAGTGSLASIAQLNSLSGFVLAASGSLDNRIALTGQQAWSAANNNGINLSGNLSITGATLFNRDTAISGALEGRIAATGSAAVNYATSIGQIISGNLTQTGITLISQINTLSGFSTGLSGSLDARIIATGNAAVNHANGIGTILSGNLTQTGIQLTNNIASLSGWTNQMFVHRTGDELISGSKYFTGGKIGIGTINPQAALQVMGGFIGVDRVNGGFQFYGNDTAARSTITSNANNDINLNPTSMGTSFMVSNSNGGVKVGRYMSTGAFNPPDNGALIEGAVGIGTQSPAQFLHVTGNIRSDAGYFSGTSNLADIFATKVALSGLSGYNSTGTFGEPAINNLPVRPVVVIRGGNNSEMGTNGYDNIRPAHGIQFLGFWNGVSQTDRGGIYSYGSASWGGGLAFYVKSRDGVQTNPAQQRMIISPNGDVGMNLASGVSPSDNLHVSGFIRSDGGFRSGSTNLADILYPRSNPSGFITGLAGTGSLASLAQLNSLSGWTDQNFVHRTGQELISGRKIFVSSPILTGIEFLGVSGSGIFLNVLSDGAVAFNGSGGSVLNIEGNTTGSLFAVVDEYESPIFEVSSDGKVTAGDFLTYAFVVSGSGVSFGANYVPSGYNVFISGNTQYIGNIFSGTTNIADIFYPRNNPSGFITGLAGTGSLATLIQLNSLSGWTDSIFVHRTGQELISGDKTFTGLAYFAGQRTVSNGQITVGATSANGAGAITFLRAGGSAQGLVGYSSSTDLGDFLIQSFGGAGVVRLSVPGANTGILLNNNGNVGLSIVNPQDNLHVSGFVRSDAGFRSGAINLGDIFYPRNSNPSGYLISGALNDIVYTTGAQTITGLKQWNSGIFWNNVGINKANPSGILEIYRKESSDRNIYADLLVLNHDGPSSPPFNGFGIGIIFKGQTYAGGTNRNWARIGSRLNDSSLSYQGANLVFETTPNNNDSILVERMRITPSGNVGIGLISPFFKLDVSGGINASGGLFRSGIDIASLYYSTNNPSGFITGLAGTGSLASLVQLNSLSGFVTGYSGWVSNQYVNLTTPQTIFADKTFYYNLKLKGSLNDYNNYPIMSGGAFWQTFGFGQLASVNFGDFDQVQINSFLPYSVYDYDKLNSLNISKGIFLTGGTTGIQGYTVTGGITTINFGQRQMSGFWTVDTLGLNNVTLTDGSYNPIITGWNLWNPANGEAALQFNDEVWLSSTSNGIFVGASSLNTGLARDIHGIISNGGNETLNWYQHRLKEQWTTDNLVVSGNLTVVSGQYETQKTITSNYTALSTDSRIYCNNSNPITITLPSLSSVSGMKLGIKLINTGMVTLTGTFGQKFDGSDSYIMVGQYQARELHGYNATNWYLW